MRGKITAIAFLVCLLSISRCAFAQLGKNGAKTISATVTNSNEYTTLGADAAAGNTFITVASNILNSGGNFSAPLGAGDLIMIIQMQGAMLNSATDSTWGSVLNYNNCGNYEFAEVQSTNGSSLINLTCGLANNYTDTGRVQVLRVPRYSSLTINSGGDVSCPSWNGATGGVLAIEVSGNTIINSGGSINVSGTGFRGGQLLNNVATYGIGNFVWTDPASGAQKGEGIGGYENDYLNYGGPYCKGAGGNGGGGGNAHNGGGGGGANGGNPASWSGLGNPDTSTASWKTAWNLEYNGFAYSSSSGGGKGGYTFSGIKQNPLVVPPNNSAWGGDDRDNNGGLGGRPLDYTTGKIFLGGGGGCGDQDNDAGGAGSSGGGFVYLISYGTVSGSGQVIANGTNGNNTGNYELDGGIDGAGGAGAGGSIVINSTGAITGISATANGGTGGNQTVSLVFDGDEAEGPGGGGGGGYIALSNGSIALTANGGANGTTNSGGVAGFPPNGATKAGNGTTNGVISNFSLSASDVTVCYGGIANLSVTVNGTLPVGTTIYWYNSMFGDTALASGTSFATSALIQNVTYYVGACPGTYRLPVNITVDSVSAGFAVSNTCLGTAVVFNSSAFSSGSTIRQWNWNFGDGSGTSSQPNPSYQYSAGGGYSVSLTVTDNAGCSATASQSISLAATPSVSFSALNTSGCDSLQVQFSNGTTNGQTYIWKFGDGDTSSQQAPRHTYASPGSYTVVLIASDNGCTATDSISNLITIYQKPVAAFSYGADCASRSIQLSDSSTGNIISWSWNFGDGAGQSNQQNPLYVYNADSTYTITLVVSGGGACTDTASQSVTFTAPPDVSFTAQNVFGCDSVTVTFQNNSSNAVSYSWDFGDGNSSTDTNPTHFYAGAGIYNVTLTAVSPSGCSIAQSIINMVTVDSTPPVPTITQSGDSLISSPATTYQWYFNSSLISGATGQIYIATADGQYSVVISNSSGCSVNATVQVIINGIQMQDGYHATFYPNPVIDALEISFGDKAKIPVKAELNDALGRLIWQAFPSSEKMIIDMNNLGKNVYFLTLFYSDKKTVSKIIKE